MRCGARRSAGKRRALGREDQQSRRFRRGRITQAFGFRVTGGKQHPERERQDFGDTGGGRCVQARGNADRHQRAIAAIRRRRVIRAARVIRGHRCRVIGHGYHGHRSMRAGVRPRRERSDDEADDQKERQQPAKVDRAFHRDNFAQAVPDGKSSSITKPRVSLT